jgi:hypothetical protein
VDGGHDRAPDEYEHVGGRDDFALRIDDAAVDGLCEGRRSNDEQQETEYGTGHETSSALSRADALRSAAR